MTWQDAYSNPGTAFGVIDAAHPSPGHRGADYVVDTHELVPAYERIEITAVPPVPHPALGYTVTGRNADGTYSGWAHLLVGSRPNVGDILEPGGQIGLVAGRADVHGIAWTGPHIHTTRSDSSAAAAGYGPLYDPAPFIAAAIGSEPTGGGQTPAPFPPDKLQEDTMGLHLTATKTSADAKIKAGQTYHDPLDGPLTLLSGEETDALKYFGYPIAEWPGDALRKVMKIRGRRPFDGAGKSDYTKVEY